MSTIKYSCDTCKRDIELLENREGLTSFGKCSITMGCMGEMYPIGRNPDMIRSFHPEPLRDDLENYSPRRVFYEGEYLVARRKWIVEHNLGVFPSLIVYEIADSSNTPRILKEDEYDVETIDRNKLEIRFNGSTKGIVHCISRSTSTTTTEKIPEIVKMYQVSHKHILPIAILSRVTTPYGIVDTSGSIEIDIVIQEPDQGGIYCSEVITSPITPSPWSDWTRLKTRSRREYNIKELSIPNMVVIQDIYDDVADIPDGTQFRIERVRFDDSHSFTPIRSRNLIGLLSVPPHNNSDKDLNRLYDIGDMARNADDQINYFEFIGGELHINPKNIENSYPPISKVMQ